MARKTDTEQLERDRETARHMAERVTQEPTTVVHLLVRKVIYDVPYRKRDGTPSGRGRLRRALITAGGILKSILLIPVYFVLMILEEIDIQIELRSKGKHVVYGKESAAALPFADALRQADRNAWLAWSASHVVLLTTNESGTRVLWHGTGDESPSVEINRDALRWSDRSRVDIHVDIKEASRAQREAN